MTGAQTLEKPLKTKISTSPISHPDVRHWVTSASSTPPKFAPDVPTPRPDAPTVIALQSWIQEYLDDCELRLYSPRTIETRRVFLKNLLWFLEVKRRLTCGVAELRQFFHYLKHGHEEGGGRFGNPHLQRSVRPVTVLDYYFCLRSFFDWLVAQQFIENTPFVMIAKP